jgi:hypothetical protein
MTNNEAYRLRVYGGKLDEAIRDEVGRRVPDTVRLSRMKKLRLLIRDKIETYLRERVRG